MSTSVNMGQIKMIASEFEKISAQLYQNEKKLSELMSELSTVWTGEAASSYLRAYQDTLPELQQMTKLMSNTGQTLNTIAANYGKSESSVNDMIKSTLTKG